ncbi:hypothetical protein [Sessilibacter corallicola]|uniref:hypothetical protein n=1 Tax=Sessilibacter corallicola TaxID=2904075 RepID=UPI001E4A5FCF|nr:hypothetical protein [Sessilibacter corallicola]MCE2029277.1 hypothetical protein [Sessilibacter corallicola]
MHKNVILFLTFMGLTFRAHAMDEPHRVMQSIFAVSVCFLSSISPFIFDNASTLSILVGMIVSALVGASAIKVNILKAKQIKKEMGDS